ncbi:hypothetical protein IAI53_07525 [Thauera sp. CAU 1555]|uniref:Uncharacterized protein n=1 Tax=Thauera sedimentorum TaxID=2767595 RepID=A0ABR9B8Q4_9RHOO|nr:hypothetical protein [Thauera sedimentorum]MBC9071815.1 hypothetical protein [Thauera sedimentorum]MBD8502734.1 hypothetical protein [Thauera sedimentorum]
MFCMVTFRLMVGGAGDGIRQREPMILARIPMHFTPGGGLAAACALLRRMAYPGIFPRTPMERVEAPDDM